MDVLWKVSLIVWFGCTKGDRLLFTCDFGIPDNETFCGMVQDVDDVFNWTLTSTSGKGNLGLHEDHTGNEGGTGRFLWADSKGRAGGNKAAISMPPPSNLTDGEGWLNFWYNIPGDGRLEVFVCKEGDAVFTAEHAEGEQEDEWHEQNITVSCGNSPVQITFTSTVNSERSDIGVDDLYFYDLLPNLMIVSATPHVSETSTELSTSPTKTYNSVFTQAWLTTFEASESTTSESSILPSPVKGSDLALPISLGVVAIFSIAAVTVIVCFIKKRRQQPEKRASQDSVHRYDNRAYSTGVDEVRGNTTDTRRNTNSTFSSSTWRSDVSTMNGTGTNGTLAESQRPNRSSHTSSSSESRVPEDGAEPASRHYFVLNPERASMLVENGQGQEVTNGYDPVALYDNKPERYTYIDNEDSSIAMATGAGEEGRDASGYDPVTIKDDITGGYQFIDDTGTPVTDGITNKPDLQSPYEPVAVGEKPSKSKKAKASERKAPIPAVRKNIPPQPKERMIDNVLYKPMNGEQMVDNVLYKPIQEDK